jgi:hypothetical protein
MRGSRCCVTFFSVTRDRKPSDRHSKPPRVWAPALPCVCREPLGCNLVSCLKTTRPGHAQTVRSISPAVCKPNSIPLRMEKHASVCHAIAGATIFELLAAMNGVTCRFIVTSYSPPRYLCSADRPHNADTASVAIKQFCLPLAT